MGRVGYPVGTLFSPPAIPWFEGEFNETSGTIDLAWSQEIWSGLSHQWDLWGAFKEFVIYCRNRDVPFVIVSSGLDLYIEAILASIGMLDLEYHCGRAFPGLHGYNVSYTDPNGNIIYEGLKLKFLRDFRQRDNEITFIGDGLSDLEAAKEADHIFATGHLHSLLHSSSIGHYPFANFFEILNWIKGWLKNK